MSLKVIFLVPYPLGESPSQRFRFEQYFLMLKHNQHTISVFPFLTHSGWSILCADGRTIQKITTILRGLFSRVIHLFYTLPADFVFIHREAAPVGPPMLEWIIAKVFKKKIIYDFDDAIWLTDKDESYWMQLLRCRSKVGSICRWSFKVSCGNSYLQNYASTFNTNVVLNPTTIDTTLHQKNEPSKHDPNKVIIGWTGSHSTLKYLLTVENELQQIEKTFSEVHFIVIANKPPLIKLSRLQFIPWKKESEITDLLSLDIGIMPLPDDDWSKGKCGFKALQYMALEIPCVVSPIGVNIKIVDHAVNGFFAGSSNEWIDAIKKLITDPALRRKLGVEGRKKVIHHYSVASNTGTFLGLFE